MTLALGLLAGTTMGSLGGFAQTPVGTMIRNEAVGRFLYKSGEPDSIQSNAAEVVVSLAVPALTLDVVPSRTVVRPSEILQFTLRYRNTGNGPAVALSASDSLPSQVSFVYATRSGVFDGTRVVWNSLGSLMPGEEDSVVVSVRVRGDLMAPDSTILDRGSIRAANVSSVLDSALVFVRFDVSTGTPKIEALKTVDLTSARPGMTLQYALQVNNTGTGTASGVTVVDSLPPHVTFVAATLGGSLEGGAVVWRPDTLWANAAFAAGVTVRINTDCPNGYVDNLAYVSADGLRTVTAGPAKTLVSSALAADISISLSSEEIPANGVDSVEICVNVLDGSGNLAGDGIPVLLRSSAGSFSAQSDSILLFTVGGTACTSLKSPAGKGKTIIASLIGSTIGASGTPITKAARISFYASAVGGIVFSATGEFPVSGAVAHVYDAAGNLIGSDTTRSDGKYLIPINISGNYSCVVNAVNRFGESVSTTAHVRIQVPATGGELPVTMLSAISGSLVDRNTGQVIRLEGVSLNVEQLDQQKTSGGRSLPMQMQTDSGGSYLIDSLGMGIYAVNVRTSTHSGSRVVLDTLQNAFIINANIGLDAIPGFEITKTVNKRIAEIGEAVTYVLQVHNAGSTSSISRVRIIDQLPKAFVYAAGSARMNDSIPNEPKGSRRLEWSLPDTLRPGQGVRISYMVTLGAAALESDAINKAYAMGRVGSFDSVRTAEASVQITIRPGVFTDRGIVIGKVFNDLNENGRQDDGEKGIQGVELWLEDGTRITTGEDGKYSLPEVIPGQHVVRVDNHTLPAGSVLMAHGSEFAGDGLSRFVRLTESGIARADFFVQAPNQAAIESGLITDPSDPTGLRRLAIYMVRWNAARKAETLVLQDTLPQGWHFVVDSSIALPRNASIAVSGEPARMFRSTLVQRLAGTSDVVRVPVVSDSTVAPLAPVIRGSLVFSYLKRRDAVINGKPLSVPMEFVDLLIARSALEKKSEERARPSVPPEIPKPIVVIPPIPVVTTKPPVAQQSGLPTVTPTQVRRVDTVLISAVSPRTGESSRSAVRDTAAARRPIAKSSVVKRHHPQETLAGVALEKAVAEKHMKKREDTVAIAGQQAEKAPLPNTPGFEEKPEGADSTGAGTQDEKPLLLWLAPVLLLAALLAYRTRRYLQHRKR
jgi:uncharacterized repeat protein (TIGR01451 family)